jgi:DNA-binding FadR family transcriptional regulator
MDTNNQPASRFKAMKRKQLLYQAVQDEIKAYIIDNGLAPGAPLPPETELAQQLSVSRNSVREAVKSLEALGILEARPGTGLFVSEFSFDPILNNLAFGLRFDVKQLADILEVRHHIEYGMAERVIEAVTPEQLLRLRSLLARMQEVATVGGYSPDLDEEFHQGLYENVDNSILRKILDVFWAIFREAQARVAMPPPADPLDTYMRHVDIVRALEERSVPDMQTAMQAHRGGIVRRVQMLEEAQKAAVLSS